MKILARASGIWGGRLARLRSRWRPYAGAAGMGVLAGLASLFLFGPTPSAERSAVQQVPAVPLPDVAADGAAGDLARRRSALPPLWASQPSDVPAGAEQEAAREPPPMLVAVFHTLAGFEGVFLTRDGRRLRAHKDDTLPGGFRVESLEPVSATLRSEDGERHRSRLLDERP